MEGLGGFQGRGWVEAESGVILTYRFEAHFEGWFIISPRHSNCSLKNYSGPIRDLQSFNLGALNLKFHHLGLMFGTALSMFDTGERQMKGLQLSVIILVYNSLGRLRSLL